MLAGKDARTLARELLAMTQEEFSRGVQGLADEAREAARAEAQRGRGARQRRHARTTWTCSRARSTIPSRSCASMRRGRFDEQDFRSADRDCRLENCARAETSSAPRPCSRRHSRRRTPARQDGRVPRRTSQVGGGADVRLAGVEATPREADQT